MKKIALAVFALGLAFAVQAQKYPVEKGEAAYDGNDLLSYYQGKIQKGSDQYSCEFDGILLQFASEANKTKFLADPEKYMPSYGGWCSIAMSLNALVKPNYNYYRFTPDGKVMFFEVRAFLNGIALWEKDEEKNKVKADDFYEKVLKK